MSLSPKGNQPKRYDGEYFLKIDYHGGEALSEFLISLFLESTSFKDFVPYRYIFLILVKVRLINLGILSFLCFRLY